MDSRQRRPFQSDAAPTGHARGQSGDCGLHFSGPLPPYVETIESDRIPMESVFVLLEGYLWLFPRFLRVLGNESCDLFMLKKEKGNHK